MDNMDKDEQQISRRKALGRIGLLATAAYTVPAFATLSMAQAASGNSDASDSSDASEASDGSDASDVSDASGVSAASNCETLDASAAANLEDPGYVQCMVDNNFELPADFTYPAGVTLADGTVT